MCFPPPLCGVSNRGRWHAVPEGKSERIFMSLFRCDVQFERSIGRISATRDNVFTDMVKVLYKTDTPTNVLPSIHVFNSIGVSIAISHSNDLKKHRWIQISAYILAVLIILSTMFLKQHSVTDVIAAVTMACIIYPFVYVTADKKAPKLSQQPT